MPLRSTLAVRQETQANPEVERGARATRALPLPPRISRSEIRQSPVPVHYGRSPPTPLHPERHRTTIAHKNPKHCRAMNPSPESIIPTQVFDGPQVIDLQRFAANNALAIG